MSKRLENEYKTLMNNNVPDLWARIESGLDPKEGAPKQTGQGDFFRMRDTAAGQPGKRRRRIRYRIWGTAAAACICALVAIPAWLMHGTKKAEHNSAADYSAADNSAADYAAADTASAKSADTAALEEGFTGGDASDIQAAPNNAATENGLMYSASDTTCEAAAAEPEESARGDASSGSVSTQKNADQDSITEDATVKQEALEEAAAAESAGISDFAGEEMTADVTIRSIEASSQQVIYTARVEAAADEALVGTEIEIYAGADTQERLEKGVQYRLELIRAAQEDGKIIFYQKTP